MTRHVFVINIARAPNPCDCGWDKMRKSRKYGIWWILSFLECWYISETLFWFHPFYLIFHINIIPIFVRSLDMEKRRSVFMKNHSCKNTSHFTQQLLEFPKRFKPRHNSKTELCHGLFQCENQGKNDWDNWLTIFRRTQMRARIEKMVMLIWSLSV